MHEGISVHSIDNLTNANSNPQNLLIRFVENTHHTVAVCTMYDSVCKAFDSLFVLSDGTFIDA